MRGLRDGSTLSRPTLPTRLTGARTHNLAGVDLELRPGEVVAITGVSRAGKSSLALDTLCAEGQRSHRITAHGAPSFFFGSLAGRFSERLGAHPNALAVARGHEQRRGAEGVVVGDGALLVEGLEVLGDVGGQVSRLGASALGSFVLNDDGNGFAEDYYSARYFEDYERTLRGNLSSTYHVEDTWENFDKVAAMLERRYEEWLAKRS